MATAQEHLEQHGATVEAAKSFIMDNLNNLLTVYKVCDQYGVTNDMIAEILGMDGVDGTVVANYFASHGIDSDSLGGATKTVALSLQDGAIVGTLDFVSTDNYMELYQNISLEAINSFLDHQGQYNSNFAFSTANTWSGVENFGFEGGYDSSSQFGNNAYEFNYETGYADNYSRSMNNIDLADYSEANSSNFIHGAGVVSSSYDGAAIGNYDLLIG